MTVGQVDGMIRFLTTVQWKANERKCKVDADCLCDEKHKTAGRLQQQTARPDNLSSRVRHVKVTNVRHKSRRASSC